MSSDQSHYAYGPANAEVEAVMRFGAVKRWHMIDTTRLQTLAEHSACVAALAYLIATKCNGFFGPAWQVTGAALLHDMAEVFTGDIPSHTKSQLMGIDELEHETLPHVWGYDVEPKVRMLIKLCDLADGIRFIRLHGVDVTSRHAREGLEEQLARRKREADEQWPGNVFAIVNSLIMFYAYERS